MRDFVVKGTRRIILGVGLIVALSALGVNIGPLLALIGAAGFVVAFALQDTLSNFASGIMILVYRPFDVGDVVDVASVSGTVNSLNLVSVTIKTFDNKTIIVPNNEVWNNVITNATSTLTRRVDMVFGIGYGDDMAKAQSILEDIVKHHPDTLGDPEPLVKLNELGESSVNFICRPWVRTENYWKVYWDVTRTVKERFDAEGISIPFPQRDVHIHQAAD
jgi:small conductance mechanosensitive channel